MKDKKSKNIYHTHLHILEKDTQIFEKNRNNSFADKVLFDSFDSYISELKGEIRNEDAKHPLCDFLEMRLKGQRVDNGTIPLDMLANITLNISNLIQRTTHKLTNGRDSQRVSNEIKELLNLRLTNVLPGSTRLGISLNTGQSELFETIPSTAMKEIFSLLESDSDDSFMEQVAEIGFRAAQSLRNIIIECEKNDVTFSLNWTGPFSNNNETIINKEKIHIFKERLTTTKISQPYEDILSGELSILSKYGKLEVEIGGEHIKASYPIDMLDLLRDRCKVGNHIRLLVEVTEIQNVHLGINKQNIFVKQVM